MNTSALIMMTLSVGIVSFFTIRYFWLALKTPNKSAVETNISPENAPVE
jgi:hypothetical protein